MPAIISTCFHVRDDFQAFFKAGLGYRTFKIECCGHEASFFLSQKDLATFAAQLSKTAQDINTYLAREGTNVLQK